MSKLCDCGCGGEITPTVYDKNGLRKFIHGHNRRGKGKQWTITIDGYKRIKVDHPKSDPNGYISEHTLVMEKHLGRHLKKGEVVHHKDGNKLNNDIKNLELFESPGKHYSHHVSVKAEEECGHYGWRRCTICKLYDDPKYLKKHKAGSSFHKECHAAKVLKRWRENHDKAINTL